MTLLTHKKELKKRFGVKEIDFDLFPRYNIAPQQKIPVVVQTEEKKIVEYRWGLVPFWAKDQKIGNRLINIRAETIQKKFAPFFQKMRCLIPASGFYEWKKTGAAKTPMYVQMKSNELFAFAGVYSTWKAPSEKIVRTCAIITTKPNKMLKPIHNRMPVILRPEDEGLWADPANDDYESLHELLTPFDSEVMDAYEVSDYVNKPTNTGPQCTRPVPQTDSLESYF